MNITDELRKVAAKTECANGRCEKLYRGDLDHIADRIDEQVRRDYIPLPKDADGETIHLQDRVSWDNGTFNVHELNLTADGWTTWDELHGYTVSADQCHHVKPDSWERIISDATALGAQMKRRTHQIGDFVERCKRLAGEDA